MAWTIEKVCFWMVLTAFLTAGMSSRALADSPAASDPPAAPPAENRVPPHHFVITYFYTTLRCPTCHKIEEYSKDAVRINFGNELESGKLVWRAINVDKPENKHFVKDYHLYSKHLIVSEVAGDREVRWKDLKDVWTLVRNDEKFEHYVKTEISDWLKE